MPHKHKHDWIAYIRLSVLFVARNRICSSIDRERDLWVDFKSNKLNDNNSGSARNRFPCMWIGNVCALCCSETTTTSTCFYTVCAKINKFVELGKKVLARQQQRTNEMQIIGSIHLNVVFVLPLPLLLMLMLFVLTEWILNQSHLFI